MYPIIAGIQWHHHITLLISQTAGCKQRGHLGEPISAVQYNEHVRWVLKTSQNPSEYKTKSNVAKNASVGLKEFSIKTVRQTAVCMYVHIRVCVILCSGCYNKQTEWDEWSWGARAVIWRICFVFMLHYSSSSLVSRCRGNDFCLAGITAARKRSFCVGRPQGTFRSCCYSCKTRSRNTRRLEYLQNTRGCLFVSTTGRKSIICRHPSRCFTHSTARNWTACVSLLPVRYKIIEADAFDTNIEQRAAGVRRQANSVRARVCVCVKGEKKKRALRAQYTPKPTVSQYTHRLHI